MGILSYEQETKKRLELILDSLSDSGTSIVNRWAGGRTVHTGAIRFMHHPKVKLEYLIDFVKSRQMTPQQPGEHVLVIQDTSELNYNHLNGLLKVNDLDIGLLSDNKSTEFLIHPGLAIRASTGAPLGISSLDIWNRKIGSPSRKERDYTKQPIEDKESYKWISSAEQSKAWLAPGSRMTLIGDRENDIFEYLASVPDERTDILVRSCWNKKLSTGLLLDQELEQLPWQAALDLEVKGNDKRSQRTARLQLKWTNIELVKPSKRKYLLAKYPDQVKLSVVEVCEHPDSVPQGEEPIHWRLFTTHEVNTLEDALLIVKWYKWRWFIEDLFRVLKTKGLEVESSQFGTGMALKKLVTICLAEAVKILALRQERLGTNNYDADLVFDQQEQDFLHVLNKEMEGETKKQQNPYRPRSLAWAAWIVAVLGGWTPTDMTKRPPGVITMSRGLKYFTQRYSGWKAALLYFQQISNNST